MGEETETTKRLFFSDLNRSKKQNNARRVVYALFLL